MLYMPLFVDYRGIEARLSETRLAHLRLAREEFERQKQQYHGSVAETDRVYVQAISDLNWVWSDQFPVNGATCCGYPRALAALADVLRAQGLIVRSEQPKPDVLRVWGAEGVKMSDLFTGSVQRALDELLKERAVPFDRIQFPEDDVALPPQSSRDEGDSHVQARTV